MSSDLVSEADESRGKLNAFKDRLDQGIERLTTADDAFKELLPDLHTSLDELHQWYESGVPLLTQLEQLADEATSNARSVLDLVTQSLQSPSSDLEQGIHGLTEAGQRLTTDSRQASNSLAECEQRLVESRTRLLERATHLASDLRESAEAIDSALNSLADAIDGAAQEVQRGADETRNTWQQVAQALSGQYGPAFSSACQAFQQAINEAVEQELIESLDDAEETLKGMLDDYESAFSTICDNYEQQANEMLQEMTKHVEDELQGAIKDLVRDFIDRIVRDMCEELAESLAMTQAGVTFTTSLSPLIPELIAARMALRAFNMWA